MDIKSFIQGNTAFRGLQLKDLDALEASAKVSKFGDSEAIVKQGVQGTTLWFIIEGEVEVTREVQDGVSQILSVLGAGEMFGEISVISREPTTATVTSKGNCTAVGFPSDVIMKITDANPQFLARLSSTFISRVSGSSGGMDL